MSCACVARSAAWRDLRSAASRACASSSSVITVLDSDSEERRRTVKHDARVAGPRNGRGAGEVHVHTHVGTHVVPALMSRRNNDRVAEVVDEYANVPSHTHTNWQHSTVLMAVCADHRGRVPRSWMAGTNVPDSACTGWNSRLGCCASTSVRPHLPGFGSRRSMHAFDCAQCTPRHFHTERLRGRLRTFRRGERCAHRAPMCPACAGSRGLSIHTMISLRFTPSTDTIKFNSRRFSLSPQCWQRVTLTDGSACVSVLA